MKSIRTTLCVVLLAGAAAACEANVYRDSATPAPGGYGNSIRQNASVMIIDPRPANAANTSIDLNGRRAGLAIERYRTGKVLPPVQMRTTDVLPTP